ncbi:hypothetical protein GGS23DRAFT_277663 [Durotheca rogersii]|uniref:uncharacterized protein n=1 Tax=Durotheca rogersii TaxID=419775 RepID=UPI00221E5F05|nr:uncharacterized protein GGS23DRAFT_277663 [Durotheca rogersii]KAI5866573.1 hypothetical protein GGS23DRAFT_277663 [Durotheca rogersii]
MVLFARIWCVVLAGLGAAPSSNGSSLSLSAALRAASMSSMSWKSMVAILKSWEFNGRCSVAGGYAVESRARARRSDVGGGGGAGLLSLTSTTDGLCELRLNPTPSMPLSLARALALFFVHAQMWELPVDECSYYVGKVSSENRNEWGAMGPWSSRSKLKYQ